ncbi:MAG: flagellar motor switch protein FliN [Synergistaceae bacterium]|jgi:flagellar motor switch protein FliN/FliY|nr:flagellar motor switch protein FliN [Synergistaceae bacterium]
MDELLSQDEINALLTGGSFSPPVSADLSMEDAQVLDEVATIFSNAESNVFGMLAGKDVDTRVEDTAVSTQAEFKANLSSTPFVFRTTFGGFDDIPLIFVVDRRGALTLADLMMGGEGKELPEEASELYLNAAQEGLSQVVGSAFTSLSGLLGGRRLMPENTASALEGEDWRPFAALDDEGKIWGSSASVEIEGLEPFSVRVGLPLDSAKSIADVIHQIMNEQAPKEPSPPPQPAAPAQSRSAPSPSPSFAPPPAGAQQPAPLVDVHPAEFTPLMPKGSAGGNSGIDLIADIPVRVTVELGKTRKNISEILALSTGSVIELDKMAGEPVDVLVNGKLIARGEVVVIDENFGVRITEVLNTASKAYSI